MKPSRLLPLILLPLLMTAPLGVSAATGTQLYASAGTTISAQDLAGKRVMVLGDSITQAGTYVSFIEYYLQKELPEKSFDFVSIGLASETTSGLSEPGHKAHGFARPCVHERLARALERVKPQVVMACYGMNDGIYLPLDPQRTAAFKDGITKLVEACGKAGAKVILVTPPMYDTQAPDFLKNPGYDAVLTAYAKWEMSADLPLAGRIDLHTAMREEFEKRRKTDPKFHFAPDKIHPNDFGHFVMARTILDGLGVKPPAGDLGAEFKRVMADPLYKQVAARRKLRSEAWLSEVGYKRERDIAPGSGDIAATEKKAEAMQAEIDALRKK
jgi:lysophospholipase L1-like esterase